MNKNMNKRRLLLGASMAPDSSAADSHVLRAALIRAGMGSGMRAPVDGFHARLFGRAQVCPTGVLGGVFFP